MYGIDESGYYVINIPNMPPPSVLKSIMKKGHIAHLGVKALDDPFSFEGFRIVNVKILSLDYEEEHVDRGTKEKSTCLNFKALIMDDPDKSMTGTLLSNNTFCDGELWLDLSWGNSQKTLAKLQTITDIVKERSFSAAECLTYKSYK